MPNFFENNLILFLSSYVVGIFAWVHCSKLSNIRIRFGIRASIIYLLFPIFYMGHPFLYYQCWMLLIVYITELQIGWLLVSLLILAVFILISQIFAIRKIKGSDSIE